MKSLCNKTQSFFFILNKTNTTRKQVIDNNKEGSKTKIIWVILEIQNQSKDF